MLDPTILATTLHYNIFLTAVIRLQLRFLLHYGSPAVYSEQEFPQFLCEEVEILRQLYLLLIHVVLFVQFLIGDLPWGFALTMDVIFPMLDPVYVDHVEHSGLG